MSSPLRGIVAVFIAAFFGCQVVDPLSGPPALEVTTLFVDQTPDGSHAVDRCLKELARSYVDDHDGVLFFDKTSKIRVTPPRREKSEPYHVHVLHRVAGQTLDHVVRQDGKGLIDVDVSRFEEPEALIVTSAALHLKEEDRPGPEGAHTYTAEGVAPSYTMSLKLVPSELWEPLVKLQHFRTELATPQGDFYMFTQAFNRRDMYLSWLDPAKNLRSLIDQDPYVYLKPVDAYLPPRLSVEVSTGKAVWQRAGTWPLPEWIDRLEGDADRKPFVFRTAERELFSFGPPARLDLALPKDPVAATARIDARFTGVGKDEGLKFVLACAYPLRGKGDYAARLQTHDITASDRAGSYTVSLEGLEPAISFPLTAAITHRFLNPWRTPAGMYRPVPPRQRIVLPSVPQVGPRRLHSRVVLPRYASHYDFLAFFGDGGATGRYRSLAEAYHGRPGDGPSPNVVPPTDIGTPPTPPPGTPPGGTDPGDDPAGDDPTNDPRNGGVPGAGMAGLGAGGNNGPNPPPGGGMPGITVTLKCPGKGGCGMNNCTCPKHMWTQSAVMNGIWQAFAPTGPADISFFGAHGASAPCHKVTKIAVVRVSYWGVGFQLIHVFYQVSVTFQPCMGVDKPPPPQPPPPPGVPPVGGPGPAGPGGGGGAAVVVVTGSLGGPDNVPLNVTITGLTESGPVTVTGGGLATTPGKTISLPYSDPGFMSQGGYIRNAFGGDTLPTWVFALNDQRIAGIASGFGLSYYGRPVGTEIVTSVGWNPNLTESWGIYVPGTAPSSPGGTTPPPPTTTTTGPGDYYNTGQTKPIR